MLKERGPSVLLTCYLIRLRLPSSCCCPRCCPCRRSPRCRPPVASPELSMLSSLPSSGCCPELLLSSLLSSLLSVPGCVPGTVPCHPSMLSCHPPSSSSTARVLRRYYDQFQSLLRATLYVVSLSRMCTLITLPV